MLVATQLSLHWQYTKLGKMTQHASELSHESTIDTDHNTLHMPSQIPKPLALNGAHVVVEQNKALSHSSHTVELQTANSLPLSLSLLLALSLSLSFSLSLSLSLSLYRSLSVLSLSLSLSGSLSLLRCNIAAPGVGAADV